MMKEIYFIESCIDRVTHGPGLFPCHIHAREQNNLPFGDTRCRVW
jgi:hypothetical protein